MIQGCIIHLGARIFTTEQKVLMVDTLIASIPRIRGLLSKTDVQAIAEVVDRYRLDDQDARVLSRVAVLKQVRPHPGRRLPFRD